MNFPEKDAQCHGSTHVCSLVRKGSLGELEDEPSTDGQMDPAQDENLLLVSWAIMEKNDIFSTWGREEKKNRVCPFKLLVSDIILKATLF